jgi:fatty acid desaturase
MPVASMPTTRGSDFAPLLKEVRARGLLERRNGYYARSIALNLILFGGVWAAVAFLGDSWWQLALAIPAAVFTARTSFLGHDSGHGQIARTCRFSRLLGLLHGNLLVGMSYGWWTDKHDRHHANPNHVDKDPDVAVGIVAWTPEQAAGRNGFSGWLARHQAAMFFPLLLLEGINLKVSSARDLKGRPWTELALLVMHYVCYLGLLFAVMSPGKAVAFIAVHQALYGLHLGCAFAPNHKGMPMPGPDERWDHLRKQVLTSRNVRGGPMTDWFLGGLNYQIEHHLFPNMPRANLPLAQSLVRSHCESLGVSYAEEGLVASYSRALRHLHEAGEPLRV